MKATAIAFAAALLIPAPFAGQALAQSRGDIAEERQEHPRIARAIEALQDAIDYLEKAPDTFGGHKAAAIESSRRAVEELRQALAFHARKEDRVEDRRHDRDEDRDRDRR